MAKTGDSVKLYRAGGALRLDREDAEALQALVYEALARALGGLVGVGSGCLTKPTFTFDAGEVAIGECVLFWAYPAGGEALKNPEGMVLRHNPALASQASTVNVAAYVGPETKPSFWARRVEIETTPAARKKFTSAEVDDNTPSRIEERVEFVAAMANPDPAEGWFRFARVLGWSGGAPIIRATSPWDVLEVAFEGWGFSSLSSELHDFGAGGLGAGLAMMVQQFARLADSRWAFGYNANNPDANAQPTSQPTFGPFSDPTRGIFQLDQDLAALQGNVLSRVSLAQGRFLRTSVETGVLADLATADGVTVGMDVIEVPGAVMGLKRHVQLTFSANVKVLHVTPTLSPVTPGEVDSDAINGSNGEILNISDGEALNTWAMDAQLVVSHPVAVGTNTVFNVYFVDNGAGRQRLHSFYFSAYRSW